LQHAYRKTQRMIHRRHPTGITPGEVIIDRYKVNTASGERIQVKGKGGDQGLAFTGTHFGDLALVEYNSAHHLDIIMA